MRLLAILTKPGITYTDGCSYWNISFNRGFVFQIRIIEIFNGAIYNISIRML